MVLELKATWYMRVQLAPGQGEQLGPLANYLPCQAVYRFGPMLRQ
jgi:hypothetical protein